MSESARIVEGSREPTDAEVASFIGRLNAARWLLALKRRPVRSPTPRAGDAP